MHADEIAVIADEVIPALADRGFSSDLDRCVADDRLAVIIRLFLEQFEARNGTTRVAMPLPFSCSAALTASSTSEPDAKIETLALAAERSS